MQSLEMRIARSKEKTKQLEAEKRMKENRALEVKRKQDKKRHEIIGEIFSVHFPFVSRFQPQRTKAGDKEEFTLVEVFFSLIAADKEYVSLVMKKAERISQSAKDK